MYHIYCYSTLLCIMVSHAKRHQSIKDSLGIVKSQYAQNAEKDFVESVQKQFVSCEDITFLTF